MTSLETGGPCILQTGQTTCHDTQGSEFSCAGTGQDAEFRKGIAWPEPRFELHDELVEDRLTGLHWCRDANIAEFPLTWMEALAFIHDMNHERLHGRGDWRMPNRRELRSLMSYQARMPALPSRHPFANVFSGWYWTSTSAAINPAHAWYVHMEGARMFYGGKDQSYLLWPVCGQGNDTLLATGQARCFDALGHVMDCAGSGQDGEFLHGRHWDASRFAVEGDEVYDLVTGLCWRRSADFTGGTSTWQEALDTVHELNRGLPPSAGWRLPNINELESLVDCNAHSPALPAGHPFADVRDGYWSSTTSLFEPDWAWALYLTKGAVGVGQKKDPHFHIWPVRDSRTDGPVPIRIP